MYSSFTKNRDLRWQDNFDMTLHAPPVVSFPDPFSYTLANDSVKPPKPRSQSPRREKKRVLFADETICPDKIVESDGVRVVVVDKCSVGNKVVDVEVEGKKEMKKKKEKRVKRLNELKEKNEKELLNTNTETPIANINPITTDNKSHETVSTSEEDIEDSDTENPMENYLKLASKIPETITIDTLCSPSPTSPSSLSNSWISPSTHKRVNSKSSSQTLSLSHSFTKKTTESLGEDEINELLGEKSPGEENEKRNTFLMLNGGNGKKLGNKKSASAPTSPTKQPKHKRGHSAKPKKESTSEPESDQDPTYEEDYIVNKWNTMLEGRC